MIAHIQFVFTFVSLACCHFLIQYKILKKWEENRLMCGYGNLVFRERERELVLKTYILSNFESCMFGQARCVNPSIDIQKVGHCHTGTTPPPHVTTVPTTTTTMDYQMQLVCANAALITCTSEISLICGSDYTLYQNR